MDGTQLYSYFAVTEFSCICAAVLLVRLAPPFLLGKPAEGRGGYKLIAKRRRVGQSLQSAVLQRAAAQRGGWRAEITVDGVPDT